MRHHQKGGLALTCSVGSIKQRSPSDTEGFELTLGLLEGRLHAWMHRFQRLSATASTLNAQLFEHESIIQEKEAVGLYDGKEKTVTFDNGRVYLTTHRLIYLDNAEPHRNSRYLDLKHVKQTEHWAGFLKSSAKITLVLGDASPVNGQVIDQDALYDDESLHPSAQTWACHVCGYRNLATGSNKCGLCGVTRLLDSDAPSPRAPKSPSPIVASPAIDMTLDPAVTGNLIACPSCTFLNHPSMVRCEVCNSPLSSYSSTRSSGVTTPITSSRPPTPSLAGTSTPNFVRLSFRKGGDKIFYAALKKALLAKEWDIDRRPGKRRNIPVASGSNLDATLGSRIATIGIDGLLKTIDLDARDREDDMQEALSDLEALMARAKEMVQLAQSLNTKVIESKSNDETDQASDVVYQSLTSLGLDAPAVTSEAMESEQEYQVQLARELGTLLLGTGKGKNSIPIMQDGVAEKGLIGLDQIWCLWNRARGIALVSPKDLKLASQHLAKVTNPPINVRKFKTGLTVLYTPFFSEQAFSERIQSALTAEEQPDEVAGLSTLEIARREGLSVILAEQMMELLEEQPKSKVVRDDGDVRQGVRWQYNFFEELEHMWNAERHI